jgi:hypothetical protein
MGKLQKVKKKSSDTGHFFGRRSGRAGLAASAENRLGETSEFIPE